MEYRNLGRTGVKVSSLCLGCMMFGGRTGEQTSIQMIDRAIDAGINFLDTANVYNHGLSEEMTGKALRRNGKRAQTILATKVHAKMSDEDINMQGNSRRHILQQCDASLQRLQTDWIDLYQIHRPQSDIPIDETLRALDDLVRCGKVRYIGTSTFGAWQIMESLWVSEKLALNRFVTEQPPYNLLDRRIERELVPMAQTYGIGLIPWSPLAAGFLTGKYQRGQIPADGRWKDGHGPAGRNLTDAAYDAVDQLKQLASEKKCPVSQLSLAWVAQQPGITAPIIGPRTMDQLDDNLASINVSITAEDRQRIDQIAPPGNMSVSYYNADFGPYKFR